MGLEFSQQGPRCPMHTPGCQRMQGIRWRWCMDRLMPKDKSLCWTRTAEICNRCIYMRNQVILIMLVEHSRARISQPQPTHTYFGGCNPIKHGEFGDVGSSCFWARGLSRPVCRLARWVGRVSPPQNGLKSVFYCDFLWFLFCFFYPQDHRDLGMFVGFNRFFRFVLHLRC